MIEYLKWFHIDFKLPREVRSTPISHPSRPSCFRGELLSPSYDTIMGLQSKVHPHPAFEEKLLSSLYDSTRICNFPYDANSISPVLLVRNEVYYRTIPHEISTFHSKRGPVGLVLRRRSPLTILFLHTKKTWPSVLKLTACFQLLLLIF